jgi:hypothetical protein
VRLNYRPRRGWSASESLMHLVLFCLRKVALKKISS